VWFLLVLAACPGGKEPVNPSMTPAGPGPCKQMADHMVVVVMHPDGADRKTIDAITQALVDRCVGDKWTMDAQDCFTKITSLDGTDHCASLLTVDQRDAFSKAIGAALGGSP